jgi:hypothetical protein
MAFETAEFSSSVWRQRPHLDSLRYTARERGISSLPRRLGERIEMRGVSGLDDR